MIHIMEAQRYLGRQPASDARLAAAAQKPRHPFPVLPKRGASYDAVGPYMNGAIIDVKAPIANFHYCCYSAEMPRRPPTAIVQLTLRLREDLRRRLEDAADEKEQSLNGEINQRLEKSLDGEEQAARTDYLVTQIREMKTQINDLTKVVRKLTDTRQTP
jgi:hypothetical protein